MGNIDAYFSFDIEADGPIPGPYSMISIGACLAGTFDGDRFQRSDPDERTFYRELKPISAEFDPEALAVSGLDRGDLIANGHEPGEAMADLREWILGSASHGAKPVFVAYPLGFDWMFVYHYFCNFNVNSPFGFSSFLDIKTMYATKAKSPVARSTKRHMPRHLKSKRPHTHNALDDAKGQAELFQALAEWTGKQRR